MEKIPKILTHDVGGKPDYVGNRVYFERELKSVNQLSNGQKKMTNKMWRLSNLEDEESLRFHVKDLARLLGEKIQTEIESEYGEKFDIKGVYRGGAYLQQFMTKAILLGRDINIFLNPIFIEEFQRHTNNFLEEAGGMIPLIKGAESVCEFYRSLSYDESIVFAGLNVDLDTKHSVDFLVGRSNDGEGNIDQVDLYEVKSSKPKKNQIESIHDQHIDFVRAHKEIILNGVGTIERKKTIERLRETNEESFIQMIEDRAYFLDWFIEVTSSLPEISSWNDIESIAFAMNVDPMLLAVRLRNVSDVTMMSLKYSDKQKLINIRKIIYKIPIPVSELGLYHRLIRHEGPHVGQALSWKSSVAYKLPDKTWEKDEIIIENI